MSVLIIAEAGVNHNGLLDLALHMVDAAADASADAVKFQTFSAARMVTMAAEKTAYQRRGAAATESQYDMLRRLQLSREMHEVLVARCRARGIEFLSTPFDLDSVDYLAPIVRRFKIPSGELTNLPYLRRVARHRLPVLVSTGMATLDEVRDALEALESAGLSRADVTVLHCTTQYPAPINDVNLRAMLTLRDSLGVAVGYSDHTLGIEVPVAATALGATVIEKHFTLGRGLEGPDHAASLEPDELSAMVAAIRNVERALGDGAKQPASSEAETRALTRKSIVAARPIRAGERFTSDNLAIKRPGTGISPMRWDNILGRPAPRDFAADELIEL